MPARARQPLGVMSPSRQKLKLLPHSCPAPIGGLNTKDAQAEMPETDALIIDNFTCQPTWVEFRGGSTTIATFAGFPETLMAYNALQAGTNMLYSAVTNGTLRAIYRVDNVGGGAVGAPVVGGSGNTVQAITSSQFDYIQFGNSSMEVLILLNGVDPPLFYDGTSWTYVATSGTTYTWTSGPNPLSSLRYGAVYKQRIWMVQAGTFNVYYLPQTNFAGALTAIYLGSNFKLGGYMVAIITVSIDNSAGTNDYIAFVSNLGEIVMFQGYDPANVSTWYLVAHFKVGRPIGTGRNCWQKVGQDALILTSDGAILLSQAMLTDRSQTQQLVSDKIRYSFTQNAALYGNYAGWQALLHPAANLLILQVPTSASRSTSFIYAQNTLTGAWSTWGLLASSLNSFCLEIFNDLLYEGTTGAIKQANTSSTSDDGVGVLVSLKPAFNYMGQRELQKRYAQVQIIINTNGKLAFSVYTDVDFSTTAPVGAVPVSAASAAIWNVSLWNVTYWGDAQQVVKPWIGLFGSGYCAAPYLQAVVNGISAKLQSFNYLYEPGSPFYG